MDDLTKSILKWAILLGSAPVWWPFLKTLWRDFNDALREDGGLYGSPPSALEIERIREERASRPESFHSEPYVRPGERRSPRMRGTRIGGSASRAQGGANPRGNPRKAAGAPPTRFR